MKMLIPEMVRQFRLKNIHHCHDNKFIINNNSQILNKIETLYKQKICCRIEAG